VKKPVALAIDAGFGMTKFSRRVDGAIVFDAFPSVALDAPPTADGSSLASIGGHRDVLEVSYAGRRYLAGRDVRAEVIGNDFGRDMTDAYYDSPVYHALMRAALAYMGERKIDTLCLGLPLNHHNTSGRAEKLADAYTGKIELGENHGSVEIGKVVVQPQPFGAFVGLGKRWNLLNPTLAAAKIDEIEKPADLKNLTILIVDPGEFTLDWLLMQKGVPLMKASNAIGDAGRHRIIREVHKAVQEEFGHPLGTSYYSDIDLALRTGKKMRVRNQIYDLQTERFQSVIRAAIADPVRQMLEGLRGADDRIDLVVVMGGAPEYVAAEIKKERPWLAVYWDNQKQGNEASIFGNLSGFQIWAEANT